MILQSLVRYYEDLLQQNDKKPMDERIPKLGWCLARVSYMIELKEDGTVKQIISLKTEALKPQILCVPEMFSRSGKCPPAYFLCDNAKYLMGINIEGTNSDIKDRFEDSRKKHLEILKDTESILAKAICKYFEKWDPEKAKDNPKVQGRWEELNDGGNIIFGMRDHYAQDDEEIQKTWEDYQEQIKEGQIGKCLVTGKETEIARIHRGIKGVPGAQSSGAALVSFNATAFESYGKEQSYNAPVGKYAEFAYTTALNYLLNKKEYTLRLGDSVIVYWAESAQETYQRTFFTLINPQPDNQDELKKVFGNLEKNIWIDTEDIQINPNQKFYILGLAPNAARLSVRFFYQNTFGEILNNIQKHYKRMEVIQPAWKDRIYLGIEAMLLETVSSKAKNEKQFSNMITMTLKAILANDRYPMSLYTSTVLRVRSEQGKVTSGRAAIIKAVLIKNYKWKEGEKYMALNQESEDQAYVLGRLFAVLESIQKDANPGINTTIRDRYFNSACATPALVFPILIKLKNSHTKKLEREHPEKKKWYEISLTEIIGKIEMTKDGFPKQLPLEEQGKFMLGYYHQIQKKYEKKEDK